MPSVDPSTHPDDRFEDPPLTFEGSAFDAPPDAVAPRHEERLQKILAAAGLGSRRTCERMIDEGRVTVNGKEATLGDKADATRDVIHVDGSRLVTDTRLVYLALNKPRGVVSTMDDEKGREALADYVPNLTTRVFHVGRLDLDSEGLLLLMNDGGLAHKLMHPSYEVAKTYQVEIAGPVPRAMGRELKAGVQLDDGPAKVDSFRVVDAYGKVALVEVVLHEGRNHIVRRMFDAVGFPVQRLIRTQIGPIRLGDLRPGRTRHLSQAEIGALFKAVGE
ncbi:rRNA pseudouridine synthase [Dactylosporangium aurantiacum]|uniref:RNA pseudouridylate synthase n=1 Tax=Dactylosporangium aurantiacum TaxID=35754 RepID=A0A9Q9ICN6_9ACTN|nr:pseudouridine synthase [Dactylosporangium aurantiacum]MDG6101367.1 pseudouridine synthase [Dactylosporangium aurantiacum]UWZ52776.1 rRNA pseudouridine synthase [Dactylosporangium aurantiacum]